MRDILVNVKKIYPFEPNVKLHSTKKKYFMYFWGDKNISIQNNSENVLMKSNDKQR